MKLRFTPRATEDIIEIGSYFSERNTDAGHRVRGAIYEGLQTLLLFPHAGRPQKLGQVRKFVTPRYNYLIYYVTEDSVDEIVVLNVKHPARAREHQDK
jgi:plasmid stabilization system protein ParE